MSPSLTTRLISFIRRNFRALFSPIISFWENSYFNKGDKNIDDVPQPVFIIGAPRTGSTILYQALTNVYDVKYIDNVAANWCRNLRFGMWLSYKRFGDLPHDNFEAEYGNTSKFGEHAPSECGSFWYRWLPKNRHFIDYDQITDTMVEELQCEVLGVSSFFGKPMLFKNLNAGQRLRLISKAFPGARIIFIRRDPRFVVRSIMKARARVGCKPTDWWSIMPPNVDELKKLPEIDLCTSQVYFIEKQIEDDLKLFPANNVFEINYQDMNPDYIDTIASALGLIRRDGSKYPRFIKDNLNNIEAGELEMLESAIGMYPFKKELFN